MLPVYLDWELQQIYGPLILKMPGNASARE